jgi:hypothetical protein
MNIVNKKTIQNILNMIINQDVRSLKKACEKRGFSSNTCSDIFEISLCLAYYDGYNAAMSELGQKKKEDIQKKQFRKYIVQSEDEGLYIVELTEDQLKVFDFLKDYFRFYDIDVISLKDYKAINISKEC